MSISLRASDDGIKQIKKAIKQVGFNQTSFAEHLKISRSTMTSLFQGKGIKRDTFEELCKFLELDWRDIQGGEESVSDDLDLLVQEVKQKIAADVTERCGTMRVLDMTQPVDLDRIYTDVNIIKDVIGRRRIGYDEVMEVCTREHFDRFLVGTIKERVKGFEAVEEFQKLVVLGKPGAGKTTFMKYLAMSCLGGRFHGELVPIFVTLKAYAEERGQPSLENYILTEFQKREVGLDEVMRLLKEGKALILLDGLDEVKKEDDRRVKQDIDQFSRDWLKNRFAITCRIAAREYQFEKFTEVEMADFDDGQIEIFVNNWFRERDESKSERMLERLKDNEPVKELATNPLLLTLLCLVFGERNDFPPKRSELYKEGLEVLMKKWDAKRNIEREIIYKHLSPQNKEDMLGQIAFNTFVNGEYFFRQEDLQRQIKDYICNLPESSADPEALRLDSEAVLKAIEHHHGLLVERARNIYSFSHLTFQEYFAAKAIERSQKLKILVQNISNPRWKEVFYLTAEMLWRSDDLIKMMKDRIDGMLAGDEKLQSFLEWSNQKTNTVEFSYKPVAVRAFYLYAIIYTIIDDKLFVWAGPNFEPEPELKLDFTLVEVIYRLRPSIYDTNTRAVVYPSALKLVNILDKNHISDRDRFRYFKFDLDVCLAKQIGDDRLYQCLQELGDQFPVSNQELKEYKLNVEEWIKKYRELCIDRRNIGHDWQFTDEQAELLNQYFNANLLLVECMNRSYVSKQVREEIESTMLLPSKK
jgi:predicted NACHT family NTPase